MTRGTQWVKAWKFQIAYPFAGEKVTSIPGL